MQGKIYFILNEKLSRGNYFDITVDDEYIGKVSEHNKTFTYVANKLKDYKICIKNEKSEKTETLSLSENKSEQTIEIIATADNKMYYLYLAYILLYILVIVICYFILDIGIYYVLILMVLALPLIIYKLLSNNSESSKFYIRNI